jgi:electron transfer flavoprotein alpha subunit
MATLLLAEHDNAKLSEQTARALSAALKVGGEIDILIAGKDCRSVAEAAATLGGVRKVLLADGDQVAHRLAEPMAQLIVGLAPGYDAFLAAATADGKNTMPRVAALLDVMQVSEIIDVVSADTFKRLIYAGNAVQTVQSVDAKKVITVRTASFAPAPSGGQAMIEAVAFTSGSDVELSRFLGEEIASSDLPELSAASVVISGGRAFGSADKFNELILPIATKLGAAVGASRAAVDAGYAPNDLQVGQTGKVVAPDLYIACGISGAIQHLAGMKDSKVIVAINKDGDAPIFQIADYGLVGDLFVILPELEKLL